MGPVVLFKGKGNIDVDERQRYQKGVHVIFTPKAVIHDGYPKLFIADSADSHVKPEIIKTLQKFFP